MNNIKVGDIFVRFLLSNDRGEICTVVNNNYDKWGIEVYFPFSDLENQYWESGWFCLKDPPHNCYIEKCNVYFRRPTQEELKQYKILSILK